MSYKMRSETSHDHEDAVPLLPVSSSSSPSPEPLPQPHPPKERDTLISAKDGGYGWIVVSATFVINMMLAGYMKSFGLLYEPIMEYFPGSSVADASWMMGLLEGCNSMLAPVMGAVTVLLGARWCSVCGAILISFGLLLAVAATSVLQLALTLGGLVGIGLCMCETPGIIIISEYFFHRRATANGLRAAGMPFGGVIFPFILLILSQEYPLRGLFLMLSGITLQMCVLGMLLRPFETHIMITKRRNYAMLRIEPLSDEVSACLEEEEICETSPRSPTKKQPLDFSLLKNPMYIVYILMAFCTSMALTNVIYYIPIYGTNVGLSKKENSIIVAFHSIVDFISRILIGWLSDKNLYQKRNAFIFGQLLSGVGCLLVPLTSSIWTMMAVVWLPSVGDGFFWTLVCTLMADQFGEKAMATAWGFFKMTQGICSFAYPFLLGLLADKSGWIGAPFILMGTMCILGGIVFALQPRKTLKFEIDFT